MHFFNFRLESRRYFPTIIDNIDSSPTSGASRAEVLNDASLLQYMYNAARKSTLSKGFSDADVEDAVQEAFKNAVHGIHTFRGESQLSTWLFKIVLNTLKNEIRRRRSKSGRLLVPVESFDGMEPESREAAPDEGTAPPDAHTIVYQALGQLSEDQKAVVLLQLEKDFSYKQIAGELNLRVGQVRGRMHRAFLRLRRTIADLKNREE